MRFFIREISLGFIDTAKNFNGTQLNIHLNISFFKVSSSCGREITDDLYLIIHNQIIRDFFKQSNLHLEVLDTKTIPILTQRLSEFLQSLTHKGFVDVDIFESI